MCVLGAIFVYLRNEFGVFVVNESCRVLFRFGCQLRVVSMSDVRFRRVIFIGKNWCACYSLCSVVGRARFVICQVFCIIVIWVVVAVVMMVVGFRSSGVL